MGRTHRRFLPAFLALSLVAALLAASPVPGAAQDSGQAYGVIRRIPSAARITVAPRSGLFSPGAAVEIHDKLGNRVCAGSVRSAYDDVVYVDVSEEDAPRLQRGYVVSANGDAEKIRALLADPSARREEAKDELTRYGIPGLIDVVDRGTGGGTGRECRIDALPRDFEVHAVATYAGVKKVDVQLGRSGHEVREAEVVVNVPDAPVVLVLMAYDPVVWKVRRTQASRIAAVVIGSYHTQALLGIPKATPVLYAGYEEKTRCEYFYAYKASDELDRADARIRELVGRGIDHLVTKRTGDSFVVGKTEGLAGATLVSSTEVALDDFVDKNAFPTGQKGIDLLVKQGKLRPATREDIERWIDKASEKYSRFGRDLRARHRMRVGDTYVVLGPVDLPEGLFGAHSRSFIVPDGTSAPGGSAGHNSFYYMSTGQCLLGSRPCPE
jgi:hypothetical protein